MGERVTENDATNRDYEMNAGNRVGVDVGGTFTDFVNIGSNGDLRVWKRLSTPADPSEAVVCGIREALAGGSPAPGFGVVHGTTVATNALLERRGARTALITTRGFRDVLEIGRQARQNLYGLHPRRAAPLLPRELRFEALERCDWTGAVLVPLDYTMLERVLDELAGTCVESIAVCLLFSYLNPAHEQAIARAARRRGFAVSLSSDIAPEPREFERTTTTVANAFVAPVMAAYLGRLAGELTESGTVSLRIMQSDGGALSAEEASVRAIKTVLSGPAGGVVASAYVGKRAGFPHLLTFDMGGTSTDVALILDGECPVVTLSETAGIPIRTPTLDIHTVGAGGGSLAWLDAVGGLRVGPQSAGANPGPVAYGRGDQLTVTDADVYLGRLPADSRLGGSLALDVGRVRVSMREMARDMGIREEAVATGIVSVVNAAMTRALRHISVERGHDPSAFTLLSFGGAGGLHAAALAESLGIGRVLVPRHPGAFSAVGLVLADIRREYVKLLPAGDGAPVIGSDRWTRLEPMFAGLESIAARDMEREGADPRALCYRRLLDMRYAGQSFDLRVPVVESDLGATVTAFHEAHRGRYGHADAREPVEIVAVRLVAVAPTGAELPDPRLPAVPGKPVGTTRLFAGETWIDAPIYLRRDLALYQRVEGPAVVSQEDATTVLEAGWCGVTDPRGNLVLSM